MKVLYYTIVLMFSFSSVFFLFSLNGVSVYGIFIVEDNDENPSDTMAKMILIEQKYKSDNNKLTSC